MKDYPFSTWEDYYAALTECLCTTSYNMIYPKYYEKTSEYGFITDIEIMTDLLKNGLNPQEGLDGFMKSLIDGSRYAKEVKEYIPKVIDLFLAKGAIINSNILFDRVFDNCGMSHFEDEITCGGYEIRGMLIDILADYNIDFSTYANWSEVKAMYWEDIPGYNKYTYDEGRFMVLKYYSQHLLFN